MKDMMMDDDVENMGIMQGFLEDVGEEEDELEEEESSEEASAARMLDRRPDSPEILMNNLRGDMRSIDARREELADLVGFAAASETPDAVLAMLQPVLAQQGGIGALPQSSDMAQGPQPPMPPPPGAMMGSPPPLPPVGAAPIPGAMAAPAGLPPGGGMAPGPMVGPDGQPIPPEGIPPIAMRDGGFVQRFSNGSDEEGVTQDEEETGAFGPGLYSPEMVQLAPEVDLRERVREREKLYQELLGDDKSSQQAQLLFALAQKGLQFAGNVDAQGRPLRGSTASRFAAVASELPGDISKFIAEADKRRMGIRSAAIEAAEREASEVRKNNLKVIEAQRKGYADRFGKGGMGPFYETVLTPGFAQAYADGVLTPDENNLFEFSANRVIADALSKKEVYKDELGRDVERTVPGYEVPAFLTNALAQRRQLDALGVVASGPATTGTVPVTTGARVAPASQPPAVTPGAEVTTPAPTVGGPQPTLWEMAPTLTTLDVAKGIVARNVPFTGNIAPEAQQNQNYYNNMVRELVRIMQNSPRFAEGERESIEAELDMGLKIRRDVNAMRNIFIGVDRFLAEKLEAAKRDAANPDAIPEIQKAALEDIRSITDFRRRLIPPKVNSLEEVRTLPVGSPFFYKDYRNFRTRQ